MFESVADVLVLDDSQELREVLSALIQYKTGRICVCAESLDELIEMKERVLGTQLAILDINLGGGKPSGVDAYHWLKSENYRGQIYFFSGHGHSTQMDEAIAATGIPVLSKPLPTNVLMGVIEGAFRPRVGS